MYNNIDNLGIMMLFAIVLGIVMIWLFSKFAKRDSEGWDKSHERKGVKITRIVLMCVWGFFVIASLLSIIISWDNMNDIQLFSLTCFFMLGISFFCYGLKFRQSPRGAWVRVRKIIAYILISFLYIMESGIPNVKGTFWDIFLASILVSGIFILLIWLLLKPYNRDKYIPYKQTEEGNKTQNVFPVIDNMQENMSYEKSMSKQDALALTKIISDKNENSAVNASIDIPNLNNMETLRQPFQSEKQTVFDKSTHQEQFETKKDIIVTKPNSGPNPLLLFIKRRWKWIVGTILLITITIVSILLFNYIHNEYIPKKKLDKVVADIMEKFDTEKTRTEYAFHIIEKNYDWGYSRIYYYQDGFGNERNGNDYIKQELLDYRNKAFSWIRSKAQHGDVECQFYLGNIYSFGSSEYYVNFLLQDKVKAAYWFLKAAQNGCIKAYFRIGMCYMNGIGVEENMSKAVEWIQKGAEAGDRLAQYYYGDFYLEGVKIKTGSHFERKPFYDLSGYVVLWYEKVEVDDYKTLIPQDIEQAKYWWKKSAAQGYWEAQNRLEKIYD